MFNQFLQTVTSQAGTNVFAGYYKAQDGNMKVLHRWVNFADPVGTNNTYNDLVRRGMTVYYGVGSFTAASGELKRRQDHCVAMRSFFLDIDAGEKKYAKHGPDKVYQSWQHAVEALDTLLALGELPPPTYIVRSGEGLHVYWTMVEDMSPVEWEPLATRLKDYCRVQGLKADLALTTNSACVLRPVGSMHYGANRQVEVLRAGNLFYKADLTHRLTALAPAASSPHRMAPPPGFAPQLTHGTSMGAIAGYKPSSFGKIIALQEYERSGCAQLYEMYKHQEHVPEPLWFSGLSIAHSCVVDGKEWIHKLSDQYPGYDAAAVEEKVTHVRGPHKCSDIEAANPGGCDGCPHKGRLVSPIVLGYNADQRPQVVMAPLSTNTKVQEEFVIPTYPWPFFRKPEGGIYIEWEKPAKKGAKNEGEPEVEEICVLPYDFYIYERIKDPLKGQRYWCRYHSPHDGVIEFDLTADMVHSVNDALKNKLTGVGVAVTSKQQWDKISMFINLSNRSLVENRAALAELTQMGWTDRGTFVIGRLEYSRNGVRPAPVGDSAVAAKFTKAYEIKAPGDDRAAGLATWNRCLQAMYNQGPSCLPPQFVISTSFGAPFAARYGLKEHAGGIINLASYGSGRGKTFTCQTALRVFADPSELTYSSKDGITNNALMTVLAYSNSLPILRDEVTEMNVDEVAGLIYDATRLGDKERAAGSDNDIRANRMSWRTFFYATTNKSIYDFMSVQRAASAPFIYRVTELVFQKLDHIDNNPGEAKALASEINSVTGVAGDVLLQWMVMNDDEARKLWDDVYAWATASFGLTAEERYWTTHLVSACVGAVIAAKLGISPFAPGPILEFAGTLVTTMRQRVANEATYSSDYMAQMIETNLDRVLRLTTAGQEIVLAEDIPHKRIDIRLDIPKGFYYITPGIIKTFCKDNAVSLNDFEDELRRRGGVPGKSVRMLAGTQYASLGNAQRVWEVPIPKEAPL